MIFPLRLYVRLPSRYEGLHSLQALQSKGMLRASHIGRSSGPAIGALLGQPMASSASA